MTLQPEVNLVEKILSTIRRKHAKDEWRFDYHTVHHRWETYRIVVDWPTGLHKWLFDTFGPTRSMDSNSDWDYYGGWIYFYDEKYITMFLLRWA
jgi:hypothetical protein